MNGFENGFIAKIRPENIGKNAELDEVKWKGYHALKLVKFDDK